MIERCDVVVVGAGAAGLAAARALSRGAAATIVLEARDRIGGRILTREDAALPVAIDIGGEFVHGASESTFALLRAANTVPVDTGETSFAYENGELGARDDPFEVMARVMARARALRDDVSLDEFLRSLPDDPSTARERRYARAFAEGFDAADPARASTRALADEWSGGESGQTSRQFRPLGGYGRVLRALTGSLDPARVALRLSTAVASIAYSAAGVTVEARTASGAPLALHARAAIVTLPVGVLQAGGVAFDPALPAATRDALRCLPMGPVVKLGLQFRSAFWEDARDARYRDGAFFHNPDAAFPAFWTLLPLRAPILLAWAGGPKADALAGRDARALAEVALADLRALFGDERDPAAELEAVYTHDWQADPYARGAYSYVAVGGYGARERLAASVCGVVFFAGEATAPASEAGTVAGALSEGERAARDVLAALGR